MLDTFPNDVNKVMKQFKKLSADVSLLRVFCEAGPTESGLCRWLKQAGIDCIVVAPSPGAGKRDICCSPGLMKSARCQLRERFARLQLLRDF